MMDLDIPIMVIKYAIVSITNTFNFLEVGEQSSWEINYI